MWDYSNKTMITIYQLMPLHFFSGLSTFWEEKGILKMEYQMTYHKTLPKNETEKVWVTQINKLFESKHYKF